VTEAFPSDEGPGCLIRDRDCTYGDSYTRGIRASAIRDDPAAVRSSWQNGEVERLIGSIRRECLHHVIVFGEAHLRRILEALSPTTMKFELT
jgi:transposase InsO family protein